MYYSTNSYGGISLVSCFAKLFNTTLNKRLKEWTEPNDKITDAQFGFKANYSTVDAIFIKSLCMSQRLLVLQKILIFFSYYYYYYSYSSSSSRQNLVRTSPPTVLMIQICHLAHILI